MGVVYSWDWESGYPAGSHQGGAASFDLSTAQHHSGTQSFTIQTTGQGGGCNFFGSPVTLAPSTAYLIESWVYATDNCYVSPMSLYDNGGSHTYIVSVNPKYVFVLANTWTKLQYYGVTPSTATTSFNMHVNGAFTNTTGTSSTTVRLYWDDFSVSTIDVPNTDFSYSNVTGFTPITSSFTGTLTPNSSISDTLFYNYYLPPGCAPVNATWWWDAIQHSGSVALVTKATDANTDAYVYFNSTLDLKPNTQYYWELWLAPNSDCYIDSSAFSLQESDGSFRTCGSGSVQNVGTGFVHLTAWTWYKFWGIGTTTSDWSANSRFISRLARNSTNTVNDTNTCICLDLLKVVPVNLTYNFGDGETSTTLSPSHQYTKAGVFDVSLTASYYASSYINEKQCIVKTQSAATPTANLSSVGEAAGFIEVATGTTVQFIDKSSTTGNNLIVGDFETVYPSSRIYQNLATYSRSTSQAHTGSYSLSVINTNTTDPYVDFHSSCYINMSTRYIVKGWAFCTENSYFKEPRFYENGGNYRAFADGWGRGQIQLPANTWTYFEFSGVTESNRVSETQIRFFGAFNSDGTVNTTQTIYYDDISFTPITYLWNFGDTATSTNYNPTHQYNTEGMYNVSLTVTTNNGLNNAVTLNRYVYVHPKATPTANFTRTPTSGNVPFDVTFTDGTDYSGTNLIKNNGFETDYPGTSNSASSNITFSRSIIQKHSGSYSLLISSSVSCNGVVDFFDVCRLKPNTQYLVSAWVFCTSQTYVQKPIIYEGAGSYRNLDDSVTTTSVQIPANTWTYISYYNTTQSDRISNNVLRLKPALLVNNNSDTSKNIYWDDISVVEVTWAWNFGDTGTSAVRNPVHKYEVGGTYPVSLTTTVCGSSNLYTMNSSVIASALRDVSSSLSGTGTITNANANIKLMVVSSLSGTGIITNANENIKSMVVSSLGGTGTSTSYPALDIVIASVLTALGQVTEYLYTFYHAASSLSGTGSFTESHILGTYLFVTSELSGTGDSDASVVLKSYVQKSSTLEGTGSTTANCHVLYEIVSSLEGTGSITIQNYLFDCLTSSLEGSGSLSDTWSFCIGLVSTLEGTGSITADYYTYDMMNSNISGTGLITTNLLVDGSMGATINGTGEYNAYLYTVYYFVNTELTSESTYEAILRIPMEILSDLSGEGETSNYIYLFDAMISNVSGTGTITTYVYEYYHMSRNIIGEGAIDVYLYSNEFINSSISGTGIQINRLYFNLHQKEFAYGKGSYLALLTLKSLNNATIRFIPLGFLPPFYFPKELFWTSKIDRINIEPTEMNFILYFREFDCILTDV